MEFTPYVQPNVSIEAAVTKYNHIVKQKHWDQIAPKDTNKLVLTIKLDLLESAFNTSSTKHPKEGTGGGGGTQN